MSFQFSLESNKEFPLMEGLPSVAGFLPSGAIGGEGEGPCEQSAHGSRILESAAFSFSVAGGERAVLCPQSRPNAAVPGFWRTSFFLDGAAQPGDLTHLQ